MRKIFVIYSVRHGKYFTENFSQQWWAGISDALEFTDKITAEEFLDTAKLKELHFLGAIFEIKEYYKPKTK